MFQYWCFLSDVLKLMFWSWCFILHFLMLWRQNPFFETSKMTMLQHQKWPAQTSFLPCWNMGQTGYWRAPYYMHLCIFCVQVYVHRIYSPISYFTHFLQIDFSRYSFCDLNNLTRGTIIWIFKIQIMRIIIII